MEPGVPAIAWTESSLARTLTLPVQYHHRYHPHSCLPNHRRKPLVTSAHTRRETSRQASIREQSSATAPATLGRGSKKGRSREGTDPTTMGGKCVANNVRGTVRAWHNP